MRSRKSRSFCNIWTACPNLLRGAPQGVFKGQRRFMGPTLPLKTLWAEQSGT
jgi:hypothetical protein